MVCFWAEQGDSLSVKSLIENTEADAYATSLPEAVQLCMKAAKGELKGEEAVAEPTPPPASDKTKRREPRRKSQSAAA
jgi:hypothetical protein